MHWQAGRQAGQALLVASSRSLYSPQHQARVCCTLLLWGLVQTALTAECGRALPCPACSIKERLHTKLVESGSAVISRPMDWRALGVPEWLADRAERLGFLFPTGTYLLLSAPQTACHAPVNQQAAQHTATAMLLLSHCCACAGCSSWLSHTQGHVQLEDGLEPSGPHLRMSCLPCTLRASSSSSQVLTGCGRLLWCCLPCMQRSSAALHLSSSPVLTA